MKNLPAAWRRSALGAAVFCCLTQLAAAETVTAPNGSATPLPGQAGQPDQTDVTNPAAGKPTQKQEINGPLPVTWNDTYIGYRYGNDYHYPGVGAKVVQNVGYLTTTGGFAFGSYAFNVDYLVSNAANPEAGGPSDGGAQEIYSVGRVELSGGKILNRPIGFGPFRDFGLTVGYEFGTKNDAYAERARMLVVGPTVEFALPRGFWNLTVGARTESNHNGITDVDVHFNTAWHAESSWLYPFRIGPVPVIFRGFASLTGPKGRDGFGVETTTEFLLRTALLADVGSLAGHPRVIYAGVGYEYWHHMYGSPTSETTGTITSAPMLMAELHF